MKTVTLGNLLLSSQYGTNEAPNPDGNIDVIGMKNIVDGKIDTRNLSKVQMSDKEISDYLLSRGDILINRTNSIDLVGKTGIYDSDQTAVFASYLVRLKPDPQKINPYYLNYWLNGQDAQKTIKRIVTKAVSQANINPTELKKHCSVMLPSLEGQAKIVEILQSVDITIQTTERLITAKERYYDGLLSRIIYKEIFPKKHVNLITREVSVRNKNSCERVLSVTNKTGFVLPEDQFERRVASENVSNYKLVRKGQYAYNPSRINVGSIARLDDWEEGILSPMYTIFELDESKVNSDFFLHWLSSHHAKQRIKKSAQGSVRETVSFDDFGAILIPLPSLDEQQSIADILNTAKREIDLLKKIAESYRIQKRGLMQKLLSGEWRVTA